MVNPTILTSKLHFFKPNFIVENTVFRNIVGPCLISGKPDLSWSDFTINIPQAAVLRDLLFVDNMKTTNPAGWDTGVIYISRNVGTGSLIIEDCTFVNCNNVCIYLDDLASNVYVKNCKFINCVQAFNIGGGRNILVENCFEINSKIPSVIDNRAKLWLQTPANPNGSPRGCRDRLQPKGQHDIELRAFGFPQLSGPIDWNTNGVIKDSNINFQFVDDSAKFWQII